MKPSHTSSAPENDAASNLWRYLEILRKRMWIVAAVVAVGVTAAFLYTERQAKIYQATARVVINPQPPQVLGSQVQEVIQLGTGSYWSNKEYYSTQVEILERYELAKTTVLSVPTLPDGKPIDDVPLYNRLVPAEQFPELGDADRVDRAATLLQKILKAKQDADTRVVAINVQHTDGKLAIDLANTHADTYVNWTKGFRSSGTAEASRFLSKELDTTAKELRSSEDALHQFMKDNDILSLTLEDKQSILAADIQRYSGALGDSRIKRIELGAARKRAQGLEGEDVLTSPVFALASNSGVVDALKDLYVREQQAFLEVNKDVGPKNLLHSAAKKKVDDLLIAIQAEAKRAMREIDEKYQAALAAENAFSGELERLKKEAFDLGPKVIEYARLERKQKGDEESYKLLLGRLQTSQISGRNEQTNVDLHERARDSSLVFPRLKLNLAIAFMLSLLAGMGLAFLLDYLDRTIKSAEDVERMVGAPLLGIIPVVVEAPSGDNPQATRERDMFVFTNPTSRAAECCRSIRTNMLFSSTDRPMSTLTVSSPRPREGKTTTTIYMGTTMAQSGQRVLLIDTDLRRPRLHKSLGVSRQRGLTNLILGDASFDDVIKTTDIPNLYVLPCGPQPPNPAELLLTNRFKQVLDELKTRFDRILLDSPPVLAVTDAVVLARLSDGVILVAQAGKTLMDDVAQSAKQFRDVDAPILGVILNDMDISDRRYGGYYYAYGGYGDNKAEAEAS